MIKFFLIISPKFFSIIYRREIFRSSSERIPQVIPTFWKSRHFKKLLFVDLQGFYTGKLFSRNSSKYSSGKSSKSCSKRILSGIFPEILPKISSATLPRLFFPKISNRVAREFFQGQIQQIFPRFLQWYLLEFIHSFIPRIHSFFSGYSRYNFWYSWCTFLGKLLDDFRL